MTEKTFPRGSGLSLPWWTPSTCPLSRITELLGEVPPRHSDVASKLAEKITNCYYLDLFDFFVKKIMLSSLLLNP